MCAEYDSRKAAVEAERLTLEVMSLATQLEIVAYQRDELIRVIALGCSPSFEELLEAAKETEDRQNG